MKYMISIWIIVWLTVWYIDNMYSIHPSYALAIGHVTGLFSMYLASKGINNENRT